MTISDTPFVPADEIRRITTGSYEHLIARIEENAAQQSKALFGEAAGAPSVIGTFSGYALMLVGGDRCFRVQYEDVKGDLRIKGATQVPLQAFSSSAEYLKTEARKAVDAFLRGAQVESSERLKTVARLIEARPLTADTHLAEGLLAMLKSERTWKMQYAERSDKFKVFLGEDTVKALREKIPAPRFAPLYEEDTTFTADLDTVTALVVEALQGVAGQLDSLREEVEKALAQLQSLAPALAEIGESGVLTALDAFAQDLINDLRSVHKAVVESFQQVARIDYLGKIHDSVTEELQQYEVAARFVIEMTSSLSEAAATRK